MLLPKVTIHECNEKLEVVDPEEFFVEPMYFKWGHTKTDQITLRSGVIDRLRNAKKILYSKGYKGWNLKIWDGYRTLKVQKILYDEYFGELHKKHPDWSNDYIKKQVEIFICPPSYDPAVPSPHNTGGAVDLTLVDTDKQEVPMGTEFDEFTERAFTNHFEKASDANSILFHKNRMLLKEILEKAGFANYPEEWWHYNFGNPQWANDTKADYAIYGSCEL